MSDPTYYPDPGTYPSPGRYPMRVPGPPQGLTQTGSVKVLASGSPRGLSTVSVEALAVTVIALSSNASIIAVGGIDDPTVSPQNTLLLRPGMGVTFAGDSFETVDLLSIRINGESGDGAFFVAETTIVPTVEPTATEPHPAGDWLYKQLAPVAYADAEHGYALRALCYAWAEPLEQLWDIANGDNGLPWERILDLNQTPPWALDWLSQLAGVRLPSGLVSTDKRQEIRNVGGAKRGTPAAMVAAAQRWLTGTKSVVLHERSDGDPYKLTVRTRLGETPYPAGVLNALMDAKPAGLILDYAVAAGQDWYSVRDRFGSWTAVSDHYPTWLDVLNDTTGSGLVGDALPFTLPHTIAA